MQKTIKTEQIETAKAMAEDFIRMTDCYSYQGELGPVEYCNFIGLDYATVRLLGPVSYGISYLKTVENKYQLDCKTFIEGIMNAKMSFSLEDDTDFLGLYTKGDSLLEKEDSSLENFFNDSLENVVRKLRETYPDVVESIEQNVIDNIRDYDLDDSDKEYFAESYIEDYPVSSVETAEGYLSSSDIKRFICDWVDGL